MKKVTLALAAVAATISAHAQTGPGANQAEANRQQREIQSVLHELGAGDQVPPLYSEEDADVGPQSVLRQRKLRWFRATVDGQAYYTDNMFFRKDGDIDAGVAVTTVEGALSTPACITRWASYRAEVGYRHQFFNYFGEDEPIIANTRLRREDFDFESSTAFAELLAQTAHYQFRFGFDYTRLIGAGDELEPLRGDGEEFYREFVPRWTVQRNFRVCDHSQVSVAYFGSYHFTEEDPLSSFGPRFEDRSERWEHAALLAYSIALPADLVVQPYYRFQFTEFANFDICEKLHTAGLGIGWYPCENFSARIFANYNWNDSDADVVDYEQLNVGGGLNVNVRF